MTFLQLPLSYLLWHYTAAWGDLFRLYCNFSWFLWNFFSIRLLSATLLSPWHRLKEGGKKAAGGLLGNLIINIILRCIGFFARLGTIGMGLSSILLLSVFFIFFLALWLVLPFLALALIAQGAVILFSF